MDLAKPVNLIFLPVNLVRNVLFHNAWTMKKLLKMALVKCVKPTLYLPEIRENAHVEHALVAKS